jgi:hypothetical protein
MSSGSMKVRQVLAARRLGATFLRFRLAKADKIHGHTPLNITMNITKVTRFFWCKEFVERLYDKGILKREEDGS